MHDHDAHATLSRPAGSSQPDMASRRALLRSSVWAAPVVGLAVATPARAASTTCAEVRGYPWMYTYLLVRNPAAGTGDWVAGTRGEVTIGEPTLALLTYLSSTSPSGATSPLTATTTAVEYWVLVPYRVNFRSSATNGWSIAYDSAKNRASSAPGFSGVQLFAYKISRQDPALTDFTSEVIPSDTDVSAGLPDAQQIVQPIFTGTVDAANSPWVRDTARNWGTSTQVPFAAEFAASGAAGGNGCRVQTVETSLIGDSTFVFTPR